MDIMRGAGVVPADNKERKRTKTKRTMVAVVPASSRTAAE